MPAMGAGEVTLYGRLNTALEYVTVSTATDGSKTGDLARLVNNRPTWA